MKKHGVTIRKKKTNEIVDFIECDFGRTSLVVLSGIRRNLSPDFVAREETIDSSELIVDKSLNDYETIDADAHAQWTENQK